MKSKSLFFTIMVMFLVAFSVSAGTQTQQLVEKAENIIVGKVVEQKAGWNADNSAIMTTVTVRVIDDLKNDAVVRTQTVVIPGGKVNDIEMKVDEAPVFKENEDVLLFLASSKESGVKTLADLKNGKFTIVDNQIVETGKYLHEFKAEILKSLGKTVAAEKRIPEKVQFGHPEVLANRETVKLMNFGKGQAQIACEDNGATPFEVIWAEDFENEFPGTDWILGHNANPALQNGYTWGKTSNNPGEGKYAAWCAEETLIPSNPDLSAGTDDHPSNAMSWMIAGPFDLSGHYAARLTFKIDQTVEPWRDGGPNDWTGVGFSIDGVWFAMGPDFQFFYNSTGGYIDYSINIEDVLGPLFDKTEVWIAFMFWSDYMITDKGTWIDDVVLSSLKEGCGAPTIAQVTPDVAPAGTGHSLKIDGYHFTNALGSAVNTRLEFFGGFTWWDDTLWIPGQDYTEFSNNKIIVDVPRGASSGPLRIIRAKDGYDYFDIKVPFGYTGAKWYPGVGTALGDDFPVVPFKVNPMNNDVSPSIVLSDAQKAAETWNEDGNAMITLMYDGESSASGPSYDGENTVSFAPITHIPFGTPSLTYFWVSNGKILEADIVLNILYPWAADKSASPDEIRVIVRNYLTNEMGNFVGLADLYGRADAKKTMFGYHDLWAEDVILDDHAIDLRPADIEGIQWIYGPGLVADFYAENPVGVSPHTVQFKDMSKSKHPITKWRWDFGDGTHSNKQNPTHIYDSDNSEARYDVSLTVWSESGMNTFKNKMVKNHYVKLNVRVASSLDAEPTVGYGPLPVQFENKTTGTASSYHWDFGDGASSTEKEPLHVYENPGVYSVTMKATGDGGEATVAIAGLVEVYKDEEHVGLTQLKLVNGSECWPNEGWDNAIDGDTYHTTGTTNAGKKGIVSAIFEFADGSTKEINRTRLMTDTGVPHKKTDWVTKFTLLVSTTGTEDGDFAEVGTFTKTTPAWDDFTFDAVNAKYIKLVVNEPSLGWRQIGEFEIYENIEVPNLAGSTITATTPHLANGVDASTITLKLADADGNPIHSMPPSAFRLVAIPDAGTTTDVIVTNPNGFAPVTETDTPGTYTTAMTSVLAEVKRVIVRVYGVRVDAANTVEFTEPVLEKADLALVSGTQTWQGEGWDNAIDGDIEGADGTVSAGPLWKEASAIFEFADHSAKAMMKYRLITETGMDNANHQVTSYELYGSATGTADEDFTLISKRERQTTDWEEFVMLPVEVKYLKLKLLEPRKTWRAIGEIEVYTTDASGLTKSAFNGKADVNVNVPDRFDLIQNYPNPFNPETAIKYNLPEASSVVLRVYNMLGQEIRTLVNGNITAGAHQVMWDARDNAGHDVSSGVYMCKFEATSGNKKFSKKMKMTLLR